MATLGTGALTYADWARTRDPDGGTADIIDLLSQTNQMLKDILVIEGNLPTGHQHTVRTGLPEATWRLLNQGVSTAKGTTAQITDACGMLEVYSEIDVALARLNGNTAEFRLQEDMAFLEGMNQQMASAYIYSNALSTPQQIMGLAPRFSTVTTTTAQSAYNVIDAGGTGSTNTSMWVVVWGPKKAHGIIPKGIEGGGGLVSQDLGEATATMAASTVGTPTLMQVYRRHYKWVTGLSVPDWRYVVRICNIDVTQLLTGNAPNLTHALIRAVNKLPTAPSSATNVQTTDSPGGSMMGQTVIYCNRVINTYLHMQAADKANLFLQMKEFAGMPVPSFLGIPVRTMDALLNTEARVT